MVNVGNVGNVEQGLAWYAQAFALATREKLANSDFEFLRLGSFLIEIVSSDHKVSSGPSGSVVYWQVNFLEVGVKRLAGLGAKHTEAPSKLNPAGQCAKCLTHEESA